MSRIIGGVKFGWAGLGGALLIMKKKKVQQEVKKEVCQEVQQKVHFLAAWPAHLLLILLLGLVIYANTFTVPFVFDDLSSIIESPIIKDWDRFISGEGYRTNPRRFVGYLTLALNYRFGGLDVTGYHLFNLVVHLGCSLLVYALVRLTFRTPQLRSTPLSARAPWIALFAALLFVAHPVQTQAVTYIVQRLASLATLFYLLTMVLYAWGRVKSEEKQGDKGKKGALLPALLFVAALVAAILAMRTKEIAFTLPLVVALYEFSFFSGGLKRKLLFLLPLLATLMIIPAGLMRSGKPWGELLSDVSAMTRETVAISRTDYLLTQFQVIVTYLRLLVLPVNQNLDYDYPISTSFFQLPVFFSFLLLLALLLCALYLYGFRIPLFASRIPNPDSRFSLPESRIPIPESRLTAFGILWFFITLSVESSVIPIRDVIYEHRLYLPSVGFFVALAALVVAMTRRFPPRTVVAACLGLVLILGVATYQRNQVWGSAVTLWQDVIAKSPAKGRAYNELGKIYLDGGQTASAIDFFQQSLQHSPAFFGAYTNLGGALLKSGRIDEGIVALQSALRLDPGSQHTKVNLGVALDAQGRYTEAIAQYEEVLQQNPGMVDARINLGMAYYKLGRLPESMEQYRRALALDPDRAEAHENIGVAYFAQGMLDEAIAALKIAIRLKPGQASTYTNLGAALHRLGRIDEAIENYQMTIRLDSRYAQAHSNLGMAYLSKGWVEQAIVELETAVQLSPDSAMFRNNLERAYRQQEGARAG
jgi:tetratricopeptide (TPR) repeat protein